MNRTITTVEELDALPVGSVIQEADYFYPDEEFGFKGTVMPREEEGWLYDNCCNRHQPSNEIALPVTVLYEPGEQLHPLPTRDEIAEAIDDVIGYLDLNDVTRAEMDTATEQAADAVLALLTGKDTQ